MTTLTQRLVRALLCPILVAAAAVSARAEVTRVEIQSRSDVLVGRPFGAAGSYEKLLGKIHFSVDPRNPHNRNIADLEKAPRNAKGLVESSSDLFVLRPKDPARGNGIVLFDVLNRGNKQLLTTFNLAQAAVDPHAAAEFGDGFLLEQGFTLVAVGWEITPTGPVAHYPPVATDNGKAIAGWISNWFVLNEPAQVFDLHSSFWTGFRSYPPIDRNDTRYRLTERQGFFGEPHLVPRDRWQFARVENGAPVADSRYLSLPTRFRPGFVYELSYETKDPLVAGLGLAALRDAASYFKYSPNDVVKATSTVAYGASQTGRLLRTFLYEGFTIDERDRAAFDAIWIQIGGASLGSFNRRWVQPSEGGFFTTSWFPFLYATTRDPATGKQDGLGARIPAGKHPKVFIVDSSSEYWDRGRAGALNHTSLDGRDVTLPDNVRVYHMTGAQHGVGRFPPAPNASSAQMGSMIDARPMMRALMADLAEWLRHGTPPPASRHARRADASLVRQDQVKFPEVPGVRWPYTVPGGFRSDLPGTLSKHPLPFFVPQVDADGNEIGGVRLPDVAVPLATHTGWSFRSEGVGVPDSLLFLTGSYIPFARTRVEREQRRDPRLSVEERYASRADYLRRVNVAARQLVQERFLLADDVPALVERAGTHWDLLLTAAPPVREGVPSDAR